MNKRGLIKYIISIIATLISFCFMYSSNIGGILPILISLLFTITIFMFYNKEKIKKNKFIYNVTLMLLIVFSTALFLYIFFTTLACFFSIECSMELKNLFVVIYPTFLFLLILLGFNDIFHKTNKTNDILVIVISTIVILIHLRYYLEPNFTHKLIAGEGYYEYSYDYIMQNYIYFSIMYLLALMHYRVNKVS